MLSYLKITFKSFLKFRKKRKSLTLVLSGAFFLIFFLISLFSTLFYNIEEYWGKMLLGNGAIVVNEYKDYKVFKPAKKKYYFSINEIDDKLKGIDGVCFSKRLRIFSLLEGYKSKQKYPLVLIGIDSKQEFSVTSNLKLAEGHLPQKGKKEICLFFYVAGNLNVSVGDTLISYVKNIDGYMDYDLLTVSGIIEPKKTQFFYGSMMVGYVPLSFATSIMAVDKDVVSEVVYSTDSFVNEAMLKFNFPEKFNFISMWNSEDIPLTMRWIYNFMLWVLLILIIGIVFSSIYHNVHLMLLERYKEIGVYLTFGASTWWILRLLLGEFTFYLLYCSFIGSIISTLIIAGINSIELHATSQMTEIFLCSTQFSIFISFKYYLYSFAILWIVVIAATIKPLLKGVSEDIIIKLLKK